MSNHLAHYLGRYRPRLLRLTHRLVAVGIAAAVAMLMVTIAIMQGFWTSYAASARHFHGDMVVIQDPEGELAPTVLSQMRADPLSAGFEESPFLLREGLLTGGGEVVGVVVKGIDLPAFMRVHAGLRLRWDEQGEDLFSRAPKSAGDPLPVILGQALDGSQRPTRLFLPTPGHPEGESVPIQVVGVFASGLYDYDHQFIVVPRSALQRLYHLKPGVVNGMAFRLHAPDQADGLMARWQEQFPELTVTTWGELNQAMFDALRLQRTTFVVLMSLFVLIALSNIAGVVGLQIWFHRRDGAILRLLGLPHGRLMRLLWRLSYRTSVVGVLVGAILGVAVVAWLRLGYGFELPESVYFIERLPLQIRALWVMGVILGTFTMASLVTGFAVVRLGRMSILKGLEST
jgi:lipoprotein-releasing system permease protein